MPEQTTPALSSDAASPYGRHDQVGPPVAGILLAAGAGRRFGLPKALMTDASGRRWLARSADVMREGGLPLIYVVLGAALESAREEVPDCCVIVEAADWEEGMGASLRAGLHAVALTPPGVRAALVMLVDTPGVGPGVVARLLTSEAPDVLARASYDGMPGHPVLIGRHHWDAVRASARGDQGARPYLAQHEVELVECGDVGSGEDIDTVEQLR